MNVRRVSHFVPPCPLNRKKRLAARGRVDAHQRTVEEVVVLREREGLAAPRLGHQARPREAGAADEVAAELLRRDLALEAERRAAAGVDRRAEVQRAGLEAVRVALAGA